MPFPYSGVFEPTLKILLILAHFSSLVKRPVRRMSITVLIFLAMSEVSHVPTPRVGVDVGIEDAAVPIMRQIRSEQPFRHEMQRRASSVPAIAVATPRVLVRLSTEKSL